jgi:hypothetical protein
MSINYNMFDNLIPTSLCTEGNSHLYQEIKLLTGSEVLTAVVPNSSVCKDMASCSQLKLK